MSLGRGLEIIVSMKQVPDISELRIDPVTHALIREGVPSIVNPYDKVALEAALRLREQFGGHITVITMGPPQARAALEECIGMGADDAILLSDRSMAAADTLATAYALSQAIRKLNFDLILSGQKAIDAETGQVGPQIAVLLGIPHICYIRSLEYLPDQRRVRVKRVNENGHEIVEGPLPILLTVTKHLCEPRLPSLQGMVRAKRMKVKWWTIKDLGGDPSLYGLKGSPTVVSKVLPPPTRGKGMILQGAPAEAVRILAKILGEKGLIRAS